MDEQEKMYLAEAGVSVLVDEEVVDNVVDVMKELHIEAGETGVFDLREITKLIHQEIAQEIAEEEAIRLAEEEKKVDDIVDDTIICGDIEALISTIEEREKYKEQVKVKEKVNEVQRKEEIAPPVELKDVAIAEPPVQVYDVEMNFDLGLDILPNPDCKHKSTVPSASAASAASPGPGVAPLLSDDQLQDYVQGQKSQKTVKRTKQVVRKFEEFIVQHHKDCRPLHTMDAQTLNNYISNYLLTAKRIDGEDFEPDTLTSIQRGLNRHVKEKQYPYSILIDPEFKASREILISRRKELKGKGKDGRPNRSDAISDEQIEMLWATNVFGANNAKSLQDTLFFYFASGYGFRGCHESRQLKWGDVMPGLDNDNHEYLELRCEHLTKTRQGGEGGHTCVYNPCVYAAADDTRCPIALYMLYRSKRPEEMKHPDSPFYLTPKKDMKPGDKTWYKATPMGINMLAKIMPFVSEACGLDGHITNHSIHRTTCQRLLASDIPSTAMIQLTGHKSVESLSHYAVATKRQQKSMSMIATGLKKRKQSEEAICPTNNPPAPPSTHEGQVSEVLTATPHPMAGVASSAAGMFAGANIAGSVNISFNYCPQTSSNVTQNDLDVVNNTQQ